jgi:hypothetical protein
MVKPSRYLGPRRRPKDAVSEIVGTLLTVSVTVVLFSGIMFYVATMPQPKGSTSASFKGESAFYTSSGLTYAVVNITQMGGQALPGSDTRVMLMVDGTSRDLSLAQGNVSRDWVPGVTWSCTVSVKSATVSIHGIIYQKSVGDVIWQGSVSDTTPSNVPTVLNRGLWDKYTTYNSPIFSGTTVRFFVTFAAGNSFSYLDTKSVRMDSMTLGLGSIVLRQSATGSLQFNSTADITAQLAWTGKKVAFYYNYTTSPGLNATMVSYATLQVLVNPNNNNGGSVNGTNENPTPQMLVNGLNGFGVFDYDTWSNSSIRYSSPQCYQFAKGLGKKAVVAVASQSVVNVRGSDVLSIYNPVTGMPYTGYPYTSFRFTFLENTGGYSVFNAIINIDDLADGYCYPVTMYLADNAQPANVFNACTNITVGSAAASGATITTYADSARTTPRTEFSITDNIYATITFPTSWGIWDERYGSLVISAFDGSKQVDAQAGGGASRNLVNGVVVYEGAAAGTAKLAVVLSVASQAPWPIGWNNYSITYGPVRGSNATGAAVACNSIRILVPAVNFDLAVGAGDLTKKSKPSEFDSVLSFYAGEYRWNRSEVVQPIASDNDPGSSGKGYSTIGFCVVADIDADSQNEIVARMDLSKGSADIVIYDRFLGEWWVKRAVVGLESSYYFAVGNLDFDNDLDLVYYKQKTDLLHPMINCGSYWQPSPMGVLDAGDINVYDMEIANLTATDGTSRGCAVVAVGDYAGTPKANLFVALSVGMSNQLTKRFNVDATNLNLREVSMKTFSSAKAVVFLLSEEGKMRANGAFNGATNTWSGWVTCNALDADPTFTTPKHMVLGYFTGTDNLDVAVLTDKTIYFVVQSPAGVFAEAARKITDSVLISSMDVCDYNGDGLDDLVYSNDTSAASATTGIWGYVRLALNTGSTGEWWYGANVNTIDTSFEPINWVSAGRIKQAAYF